MHRVPHLLIAVSLVLFLGGERALADPTAPVTVEPAPEGQGDSFVPGVRLVEEIHPVRRRQVQVH